MAAAADRTVASLRRKISVMKWRITGQNIPEFPFIAERYGIQSPERKEAALKIVNGVETLLNYVDSQTGLDPVFLDYIDGFLAKLNILYARHDMDPNQIGREISQYAIMLVEQLQATRMNVKQIQLDERHKQYLIKWYDIAIASALNAADRARLEKERNEKLKGGRRKHRTRRRRK